MDELAPPPEVIARLGEYYRRNGYVRKLDAPRRQEEKAKYKKGMEIRLVARSPGELGEIRKLLLLAGFKLAKPFIKKRTWRQPLYGVGEVARFFELIGETFHGAPTPLEIESPAPTSPSQGS